MTIAQNLEQTINELKALVIAKYPNAIFNENPFTSTMHRYASNGKTRIGHYFYANFGFSTTAPKSSIPQLDASVSRVDIKIVYENSNRTIIMNYPIDSVDVNYCSYSKKDNNKNIALGRKWNRNVVKWSSIQLRKKFEFNTILNAETAFNLETILGLKDENEIINIEAHKVKRLIVPSKDQLRQIKTGNISTSNFNKFGFTKEKNTYYHMNVKVGTKQDILHFIIRKIDLFMPDFTTRCPRTVNKRANLVA